MRVPTADELLGLLRRVLEKEFEIQEAAVIPTARLVDDLELDSLDAVLLVLRVEEETGLDLGEEELATLDTVAALVALLQRRLLGASAAS